MAQFISCCLYYVLWYAFYDIRCPIHLAVHRNGDYACFIILNTTCLWLITSRKTAVYRYFGISWDCILSPGTSQYRASLRQLCQTAQRPLANTLKILTTIAVWNAAWCCVKFVLLKLIKVYFFYILYCTAVLFLPLGWIKMNIVSAVLCTVYWENMTSSTKPELHNVLHCCRRRTEIWPQVQKI